MAAGAAKRARKQQVESQINDRRLVPFSESVEQDLADRAEWNALTAIHGPAVPASEIQPHPMTLRQPTINIWCPNAEYRVNDAFGHFDHLGMKFCYRCSGRVGDKIPVDAFFFERCKHDAPLSSAVYQKRRRGRARRVAQSVVKAVVK
jgi:hypothetical protein